MPADGLDDNVDDRGAAPGDARKHRTDLDRRRCHRHRRCNQVDPSSDHRSSGPLSTDLSPHQECAPTPHRCGATSRSEHVRVSGHDYVAAWPEPLAAETPVVYPWLGDEPRSARIRHNRPEGLSVEGEVV